MPLTVESIEKNLNDIAGVRVICSFPEDIYVLADCLLQQDDIKLIEVKDYIKIQSQMVIEVFILSLKYRYF